MPPKEEGSLYATNHQLMFESHPKMIIQISINIPNEQNQANNMTNPRLQLEHDHSFVVDIHVPLGKVSNHGTTSKPQPVFALVRPTPCIYCSFEVEPMT